MCVLEENSIHIADISTIYKDITDFLPDVYTNNNASSLRLGISYQRIFSDRLNKDAVYDFLLSVSPYDYVVDEILNHLCKEWYTLLQRLLLEHLSGGEFADMSAEMRASTQ